MSVTAYTMQVIVVHHTIGEGKTLDDPCRDVTDYRALDGAFLARHDEWLERQRRAPRSENAVSGPGGSSTPPVCAGCAGDFPGYQTRTCCGRPFCDSCYQQHSEMEHA